MKKIFLIALGASFVLNSACSKDDDGGGAPQEEINGSLSVEEGKTQLEDNSIALLDKVEAFSNNDALKEIIELAEFLSASNADDNVIVVEEQPFENTVLKTLNNFKNSDTKDVVALNAKQALTIVEETSLIEDFNDLKGVYTWNDSLEDFEQTGDSDDVIYNIAYNGKNATFSFTDFTTTIAGENEEELPTLVKANLKIDNTQVFSQEYTAAFQDGQLIPASISNTTTIAAFIFQTTYTNSNNTTINQSFNFKIGDETIMGYNYTANGMFSNEDDDLENIVNDFSGNFNFLNARLSVSAKTENFNSNDELPLDEQIALLNKDTEAVLSINQKLIASAEFYKDQDTYTDFVYNPDTNSFDEVEVTQDFVNARFLFEDGTSNDFDTYIEGSFTELEDKFEAVFEAYESLFEDVNP
jgi:hypothetical protein